MGGSVGWRGWGGELAAKRERSDLEMLTVNCCSCTCTGHEIVLHNHLTWDTMYLLLHFYITTYFT